MLVMLPSSLRRDRGVAFVAALPLVPQNAMALDAVEIRPDGSMYDAITLGPIGIDALHDTTKDAVKSATPQMHRAARDLERFAFRPGMALSAAVDKVRDMYRNGGSPVGDEAPARSAETRATALTKIEAVAKQLQVATESIAELRHMVRATSRDKRDNTALGATGYLLEQAGRLADESKSAVQAAGDLTAHVPHAWSGHIPRSSWSDDTPAD